MTDPMGKLQNPHLNKRLEGILSTLLSSYEAGTSMSSSSKGAERELFVNNFLSEVFPTHYRFSSGDITDAYDNTSGQVDIVLEFPHGFSLPVIPGAPRLFIAESVAAVIEVKSNLTNQWKQVVSKAEKVSKIQRRYARQYYEDWIERVRNTDFLSGETNDPYAASQEEVVEIYQKKLAPYNVPNMAGRYIPFYAVGFERWENPSTMNEKLIPDIDGILTFKPYPRFVGKNNCAGNQAVALVMFLESLENDILRLTPRVSTIANYFTPKAFR